MDNWEIQSWSEVVDKIALNYNLYPDEEDVVYDKGKIVNDNAGHTQCLCSLYQK